MLVLVLANLASCSLELVSIAPGPGTRFNLGHADELASLTLFNSVKFSGHLWRFLILYGL